MEGVRVRRVIKQLASTSQGDIQTTTKTSCARLACAVKRDVTSPVPVVGGEGGRQPGPALGPPCGRERQGRGRTDDSVARGVDVRVLFVAGRVRGSLLVLTVTPCAHVAVVQDTPVTNTSYTAIYDRATMCSTVLCTTLQSVRMVFVNSD